MDRHVLEYIDAKIASYKARANRGEHVLDMGRAAQTLIQIRFVAGGFSSLEPFLEHLDFQIGRHKAVGLSVSAQALGVLRGDLFAGLHLPDPVRPVVPDCPHTHEKPIGGGAYGPPGFQCIDCLRVRSA